MAELNARLLALIAFGVDIFVLHNRESMRLWKHGQGYDIPWIGLHHQLAGRVLSRQQEERRLKKGDRVALLGHGIAVLEQADEEVLVVMLGNRFSVRIGRKDIVLSRQNMRWECGISN